MRAGTVLFLVAYSALGTARAQTDEARIDAITDRYLTTVSAELEGRIDTRDAALGQEVDAKTRQPATLADGTELPAGTRLVGHIVSVQAQDRDHGRPGALLALAFDHAALKSGQTVRLRVVIQAVAPSGPAPSVAPSGRRTGGTEVAGGSGGVGTGGGAGTGTDAEAGSDAGSTGGMGDAASPAKTVKIGRQPRSGDESASTLAAQAGSPVVQAGESLSTAPRKTGVPGVWMDATAPANASGVMIAYDRNIALASGTQITLGVITR